MAEYYNFSSRENILLIKKMKKYLSIPKEAFEKNR